MGNIVLAAIVALFGLCWVFLAGNYGMLAILVAFGGCVWLLYAIIREATRRPAA